MERVRAGGEIHLELLGTAGESIVIGNGACDSTSAIRSETSGNIDGIAGGVRALQEKGIGICGGKSRFIARGLAHGGHGRGNGDSEIAGGRCVVACIRDGEDVRAVRTSGGWRTCDRSGGAGKGQSRWQISAGGFRPRVRSSATGGRKSCRVGRIDEAI